MWWGFATASVDPNRFVFDIVRRVSSFSNAVVLANRLTSRGFGGPRTLPHPTQLVPDLLRGVVRVLGVRDHDLRDLSEVRDGPLPRVIDHVDATVELRFPLLGGHLLYCDHLV